MPTVFPFEFPAQFGNPEYDWGFGNGFDGDRFRIIVEEAITGEILANDLIPIGAPTMMRALSGPSQIRVPIHSEEPSVEGIEFKPWGQWIHLEKEFLGERRIWASGLLQPSPVDEKTGIITLTAKGFSAYPEKMPMLFNWNPLVVDPFEVVHKIWNHLQSYEHGNLGITLYPALSGIEMLPGYAFDGNIFNLNFFAEFVRAADKMDCLDHINKLARDIPFDYVEQSEWNNSRTQIIKRIYLGYPKAGVDQHNLAFIQNENVIEMKPHLETEIDWASDAIIDGWWPGTQYSSTFTNADPTRYRRVVSQDDARINSTERAAVWARRKLTRRQTPSYWESIIIDMGHPNAPFGSFDVGDRIMVQGKMPVIGDVNQEHKIIAFSVDESANTCQLTLKAEGAFNYDPIYFQGSSTGTISITGTNKPLVTVQTFVGTGGILV